MDKIDSFRGKYRFLSNFYPVEGISVEHLYQSEKTQVIEEREWVLESDTPGIAKRRGRSVTMRSDWHDIKLEVMERLLRWKFSKDRFKSLLLETDDAELIEGNHWHDYYWGMCNGKGSNHLGKLLMKIRGELKDV